MLFSHGSSYNFDFIVTSNADGFMRTPIIFYKMPGNSQPQLCIGLVQNV
jgi:hypothetical protein